MTIPKEQECSAIFDEILEELKSRGFDCAVVVATSVGATPEDPEVDGTLCTYRFFGNRFAVQGSLDYVKGLMIAEDEASFIE